MKQFLESLVKSIVENPDAVVVEESQDDQDRQLLTISVDPQDMGRVIGKSGKVINSIRTIMRVVAIRQGVKVRVDILDENEKAEASSEASSQETEEQPQESIEEPTQQPEEEVETSQPTAQDLVQPPEEK